MKRGKVKIVCTMGPAVSSEKVLIALIEAGLDVARLNFSHGTHEDHGRLIELIRHSSTLTQKPVAILQDLQGIKIRVGAVAGTGMVLKKSQEVILRPLKDDESAGKADNLEEISKDGVMYISYPHLVQDLEEGEKILMNDGLLSLVVKRKTEDEVVAVVTEGGLLTSHKGVNLPGTTITVDAFTEKDRCDLDFGIKAGVDYVALSFVESPDFVTAVKERISSQGANIPVIAKIERPLGCKHIDGILQAADGIMVARGDLAVEMSPEEVPLIQKDLIRRANEWGKLVITATQMLESMCEHSRPTRAEAADVANAVIDGTDAVMTSEETSVGKFPVETVKMMRKIIETTEQKVAVKDLLSSRFQQHMDGEHRSSYAVAEASVKAAETVNARCIVAFSRTGYTARLVAKCRPRMPVIAFTPDREVLRRMSLYWGVIPFSMRQMAHTDEMIIEVENTLKSMGIAKASDMIVITASSPFSAEGKTNLLKIHRIGDLP